ncbi:MAG: CapA family protein [Thermoleophilaceae bacterium]
MPSRPAAARALARAGIDVVGIANNHLFDRLGPGVASTRAGLEAAGFGRGRGFFGAGTREDDAWAPAIRAVDGQRVGFVGCTSISGDDQKVTYVAGPRKGGAARCDEGRLRRDVAALASRTDIVVAMIHGGFEYGRDPSGQIRALSDAAVAAGATMVINHHPHVVGGLRFANGRLTAWTLGNLLFDQTVWPTFESYLLRVAARQGKVVSAWIEPLRIQHFQPTGVFGRGRRVGRPRRAGAQCRPLDRRRRTPCGSMLLASPAPLDARAAAGSRRYELDAPIGRTRPAVDRRLRSRRPGRYARSTAMERR